MHFYSCISCRVINVQNGEVTFAPPCKCAGLAELYSY